MSVSVVITRSPAMGADAASKRAATAAEPCPAMEPSRPGWKCGDQTRSSAIAARLASMPESLPDVPRRTPDVHRRQAVEARRILPAPDLHHGIDAHGDHAPDLGHVRGIKRAERVEPRLAALAASASAQRAWRAGSSTISRPRTARCTAGPPVRTADVFDQPSSGRSQIGPSSAAWISCAEALRRPGARTAARSPPQLRP